jgi:predicted transcriptional regulator
MGKENLCVLASCKQFYCPVLIVSWKREIQMLKDEQLRVLRVMSEVTHRMDLNEFAHLVELNSNDALQCIQDLTKTGYLKKSGGGYGITEKGKAVLKTQSPVSNNLEFQFYMSIGQPIGAVARSPKEFYEVTKTVDAGSLEFHTRRGDFENWVMAVLKDEALASEFEGIRQSELCGEGLRKRIIYLIEKHYGIEALR